MLVYNIFHRQPVYELRADKEVHAQRRCHNTDTQVHNHHYAEMYQINTKRLTNRYKNRCYYQNSRVCFHKRTNKKQKQID